MIFQKTVMMIDRFRIHIKFTFFVSVFLLFFLPLISYAAVFISEIAWMGTLDSANDEWIELSNDSNSSVDISGWSLIASDGSPSISLSGTISANGFFLLERTDDNSVSGVLADQIYVGALSNSGENLSLKDNSGGTVDSVLMSSGWSAGDNVTKETMQKSGSSWITASPTPKAKNQTSSSGTDSGNGDSGRDESSNSGSSHIGGGSLSSQNTAGSRNITIYAGRKREAVVGQPVEFLATWDSKSKIDLSVAKFKWNFGDGSTYGKRQAEHSYSFPGNYVVMLSMDYFGETYTARTEISILPHEVSIEIIEKDYIILKNEGTTEANLTGWVIKQSRDRGKFDFPKDTIILAQTELTFPNPFRDTNIEIVPNGAVVVSYQEFNQRKEMEEALIQVSQNISLLADKINNFSVNKISFREEVLPQKPPDEKNIEDFPILDDSGDELISNGVNTQVASAILYEESKGGLMTKIKDFFIDLFN